MAGTRSTLVERRAARRCMPRSDVFRVLPLSFSTERKSFTEETSFCHVLGGCERTRVSYERCRGYNVSAKKLLRRRMQRWRAVRGSVASRKVTASISTLFAISRSFYRPLTATLPCHSRCYLKHRLPSRFRCATRKTQPSRRRLIMMMQRTQKLLRAFFNESVRFPSETMMHRTWNSL